MKPCSIMRSMICWIRSSSCWRAPSWSPSAGSPSSRWSASSDSTPPLNNASRMASCSACIVRSSSLSLELPHGLLKPLVSSRSDSFDTRSSRSISSSRSPVYFVYLNFNGFYQPPTTTKNNQSVVVLLALASGRGHRRFVLERDRLASRPSRCRVGAVIAALLAAADLLRRVHPLEHEVDAGGEE